MSSSLWTTEANGYLTFCVSVAFLYSVIFCFFNCDFLEKSPALWVVFFPKNLASPNPYLFKHPKRKRPMRQKDA